MTISSDPNAAVKGKDRMTQQGKHIMTRQLADTADLMHLRQWEIAERLNISQSAVSRRLLKCDEIFFDRVAEKVELHKGRELDRLDRIERECWKKLEQLRVSRTTEATGDNPSPPAAGAPAPAAVPAPRKIKTINKQEEQDFSRIMEVILKCSAQRAAILGLNKTTLEIDPDSERLRRWMSLPIDELKSEVSKIDERLDRLGDQDAILAKLRSAKPNDDGNAAP